MTDLRRESRGSMVQRSFYRATFGTTRRAILRGSIAAAVNVPARAVFASPLPPRAKRGGVLRVRGWDPPHFDPQLTLNFRTNSALSFSHSKLVRHVIGPAVTPGIFVVEPDLADRWEEPDETTVVFHLRRGVRWHRKPPVNGRELVADDVKFTFDRFLGEKANPLRFMLDPVDRIEVVDRYTVRFRLKEPFVWLLDVLAAPMGTWIIAPEVVEKHGDTKRAQAVIGTGPFTLERHEPGVKAVFRANPDYFRPGMPLVDGVEWLFIEDDAVGLAAYMTTQLDAGPWYWWAVRQQDAAALKRRHPRLMTQDFLSPGTHGIFMRTDKPPFNDVRVRRAISHAIDRQAVVDAVFLRGEPTPAISRGLRAWSPRIDQLGAGAAYYRYDPGEARRLLREAGFASGLKTRMNVSAGFGADNVDAFQMVQRYLKDIGIEAELRFQEFGAYVATTVVGKFDDMAMAPFPTAWEPHSTLYGMYMPGQPRNSSHVNDPTLTSMLREQMRTRELAARRGMILDIQRRAAEQQYYVYLYCIGVTASWQPYVKNYAPNASFDYGNRAATLWLDR